MTFDELQKNWQSQQSSFELKIDSDLLLKEIQRNKKHFESIIFWRDVRETSCAPLMLVICGYFWLKHSFWQLSILLPGILFVSAFIVLDRIIQKRKSPRLSESLACCLKSSLEQINHQIWLLKNVLWWYLSPIFIGIFIFICYVAWVIRDLGILGYMLCSGYLVCCLLFYWYIYSINQKAIRKELLPRKEELHNLQYSLENSGVQE